MSCRKKQKAEKRFRPMPMAAEDHLFEIKNDIAHRVDSAYRKGHAEHSGDLLKMSTIELLEESIKESIDDLIYKLVIFGRCK